MFDESQHPACGEVAAAQNTRDTESQTYRRNSGVCPLVGRRCLLVDVCGCPGVWSLTALLLKRSNDSPGQDMFDETSADKECSKM